MSKAITDKLFQKVDRLIGDRAEIITTTENSGSPYISSLAEAQIAGAKVLETIAAYREKVDAVIIAAFGDPGLAAARDLF